MPANVIITGGSSGIGAATAARFVADGARVMNISRRPCPVDGVTHVTCDLSVDDAGPTLDRALDSWLPTGDPVVLIHNAARLDKDAVHDTSAEHLRRVLETNVIAIQRVNERVIPKMGAGSAVLYVGSTLSEKAVAGTFTYVTSKHAVVGMMRATCQDLAGRGIHTACICPGFTDTDMLRTHVPDDVLPALGEMSAFGRLVQSGEIAETLFWCSRNPVINGAVIHANLGQIER